MRPSFEEFQERMRQRDRKGQQEYGDRSYSKQPTELLREIEEELIDVANWAAILFERVDKVRRAFEALEGCQAAIMNRRALMAELVAHYAKLAEDIGHGEET